MDFSNALLNIKGGERMTRAGWNGVGMYVEAQIPDDESKMGLPYIYIKTVNDEFVPWTPSQTDLFAEDWSIAD